MRDIDMGWCRKFTRRQFISRWELMGCSQRVSMARLLWRVLFMILSHWVVQIRYADLGIKMVSGNRLRQDTQCAGVIATEKPLRHNSV